MLVENIPEVPQNQRPKRLPHTGITVHLSVKAKNSGWKPVDIRLMPNETDGDRAEAVKAYLEGIRLGTIDPDPKILKFLELEARIYGLSSGKSVAAVKPVELDGSDLAKVLDFGKTRPWSTKTSEKPQKVGRRSQRNRPAQEEMND